MDSISQKRNAKQGCPRNLGGVVLLLGVVVLVIGVVFIVQGVALNNMLMEAMQLEQATYEGAEEIEGIIDTY